MSNQPEWTGKELAILKQKYPDHTAKELIEYLPGRTELAIRCMASIRKMSKRKRARPSVAARNRKFNDPRWERAKRIGVVTL